MFESGDTRQLHQLDNVLRKFMINLLHFVQYQLEVFSIVLEVDVTVNEIEQFLLRQPLCLPSKPLNTLANALRRNYPVPAAYPGLVMVSTGTVKTSYMTREA